MVCCYTASARRRVIANQWERRRYSDGLTRAQVPPEVAHEFMLRYARKHEARAASVDEFDAAMVALRRVFSQTETNECEEDLLPQPDVMALKNRAIGRPCPIGARSAARSLRRSAEVKGKLFASGSVAAVR
jgi:hypothetical protein